MNCEELVEKVTDYLDDALSPVDQARWDHHIGECLGCQGHLGEVRVTVHVMSTLDTERLPDDLESGLLAAFRQWAGSVST
jgi:predicted anti-sigma-YlaC factor YlaD